MQGYVQKKSAALSQKRYGNSNAALSNPGSLGLRWFQEGAT